MSLPSCDATPEGEGLTERYLVEKDGEPVEACFVLEPEADPAALAALETYAQETDDSFLAADLSHWIAKIRRSNGGVSA